MSRTRAPRTRVVDTILNIGLWNPAYTPYPLAPEGKKAASFGLYYLVRDVVVSVAAFGGALLWDPSALPALAEKLGAGVSFAHRVAAVASPSLNLLVAAGFGLLGTTYFALFGHDLGRPVHTDGEV